jgi:CHAD domain-containing protein
LHQRLAAQVAELETRELQVRDHDPEGVHKARVACRRLRAALATFRPLLDDEVTDPVRDELRWWGQVLGEARDTYVAHQRLGGLVGELGDHERVRDRIDASYAARGRAADRSIDEALDSPRHRALLEALDLLVQAPPWRDDAGRPAEEVLPELVARDWRRLRREMRRARRAAHPDTALHQVRKDAKRLRYAAETLEPAWGRDATLLAVAATGLQEHLGERQDTVVSRADLDRLRAEAAAAGEDTAPYARLQAREAERAVDLDAELAEVWAALRVPARRWTC